MSQYNPDDFYPSTGKEINSSGNIVNPADSVDSSGNQGVNVNGRKTNYQRIAVNQNLAANGAQSFVINGGLGTKTINAIFKATASVAVNIQAADNSGNPMGGTGYLGSGNASNGGVILSDLGGAPYFTITVTDKSAASNTVNYIDVYWTMG